jgi:hypothetical protein
MQPVPIGVAGELYIGGAGVSNGYLNRPELTAERFLEDPFCTAGATPGRIYRTGDLARYRAGGVLEHLGRIDQQVKLRGFRIELGEIEANLEKYPGVKQCAVKLCGAGDGARLVGYWVGEIDREPTIAEFRGALAAHLPDFMIPTAFLRLETLPQTPNGKIDRGRLPDPEALRPRLESEFITPRSQTEKEIANCWQEVLNVDRVGIHDNFFELGGNSLSIVRVQNKLRTTLKRDIPLVALFQRPTIAALAELFVQGGSAQPTFDRIKERAERQRQSLGTT